MAETVSIIMPAYNSEAYITTSIQSVLSQSYQDWRLYVIDDASTDNTRAIVESFCDARICYIHKEINQGVSSARNAGILAANGRYIAFLDSDDIWEDDKLEIQIPLLESGCDIVCSHYSLFVGEPNCIVGVRNAPSKITYSRMLRGNCIGNLTGIYDQQRLGKCLQQSCGHEDYLMWLELIGRAKSVLCVPKVLARYRVLNKSLSSNKVKASIWQWKIYREKLGIGYVKSLYYWFFYSTYSISNRMKIR